MSYGSLWQRWARGVSWTWINEHYRARLPEDLDATVMTLESRDRFHAKQGRSTARVVLAQDGSAAGGLLEAAFPAPLARAAGGARRSRRAGIRPPRPNGPISSECGRWGSTCPKSSPPASASARGPLAELPDGRRADRLRGRSTRSLPRLADRLDRRAFARLKRR